jgi:nitrate reductase assembly molybdenum cofactor insertion protein NarJ
MDDRNVYAALGRLLDYPDGSTAAAIADARSLAVLDRCGVGENLAAFAEAAEGKPLVWLEEAYARAFDVSPQCVPYLSVYLFGEENFKRAELMTGLRAAYEAAGFKAGPELPDHIGTVLRFAPQFSEEEWDDMVQWCIPGPLAEMVRALTRSENPYRYVLEAIQCLVDSANAQEACHG